jgi:hypothetical protein
MRFARIVCPGLAALAAALFLVSCRGSGAPVCNQPNEAANIGAAAGSTRTLWGTWDVTIDPSSGTIEVAPLRGAEFKANVTIFLQPPKGSLANLKFSGLNLTNWASQGIMGLHQRMHRVGRIGLGIRCLGADEHSENRHVAVDGGQCI